MRELGPVVRPPSGVYSVMPPELLSVEGRTIAAMLAVGMCTFLAHATAAARLKLIRFEPAVIHLGTPHVHEEPAGVKIHRFTALREGDLTRVGRFRSTSVERTLLDYAVDAGRRRLLEALAEAEFQHDTRPADVEATLRRGHPGSANLRNALKQHVPGYGEAKSKLEKRFRQLLIKAGIDLPERNQWVGPYKLDCLWREIKLVVELDGAQHERDHQANVDAGRDLWLRSNGYTLRRYSRDQIYNQATEVLNDLDQAIAEARQRQANLTTLAAAVTRP